MTLMTTTMAMCGKVTKCITKDLHNIYKVLLTVVRNHAKVRKHVKFNFK